jgi:hypothetical protein
VSVKQERISESDADDGDGVGDAEQRGPCVRAEVEETVERDHEVTGVPTAHGQGEQCQDALDVAQIVAVSDELKQHPKREQGADAVADDL